MADERCQTCRFRENGRETHYEAYAPCRRFPPANEVKNGLQMKWPMVSRGAWCGEYQPTAPDREVIAHMAGQEVDA